MTKYILSLSAILLFTFTAFAQKGEEVELIVNNIKNGTSETELIDKLGKPLRQSKKEENNCTDGFSKTFWYNGLEIELLSDENGNDFEVSAIRVTATKWVTKEGIKVGSKLSLVKSKYGKAYISKENGMTVLSYEMKNGVGGISFYFRGNTLVRYELNPTLC